MKIIREIDFNGTIIRESRAIKLVKKYIYSLPEYIIQDNYQFLIKKDKLLAIDRNIYGWDFYFKSKNNKFYLYNSCHRFIFERNSKKWKDILFNNLANSDFLYCNPLQEIYNYIENLEIF